MLNTNVGQPRKSNFPIEKIILGGNSTSESQRCFPIKVQVLGWRYINAFWLNCNLDLCHTIELTAFYARNFHFGRCLKVKFFSFRAAMKTPHFTAFTAQRFTAGLIDIWKTALAPFVITHTHTHAHTHTHTHTHTQRETFPCNYVVLFFQLPDLFSCLQCRPNIQTWTQFF